MSVLKASTDITNILAHPIGPSKLLLFYMNELCDVVDEFMVSLKINVIIC